MVKSRLKFFRWTNLGESVGGTILKVEPLKMKRLYLCGSEGRVGANHEQPGPARIDVRGKRVDRLVIGFGRRQVVILVGKISRKIDAKHENVALPQRADDFIAEQTLVDLGATKIGIVADFGL